MFGASPFTAVAFTAAPDDGFIPPPSSVRSIVPRACRRVVVDLGLTRRQAEPTEALVRPSP